MHLPESKHLNTNKSKHVYFLTITFLVALNGHAKSTNTESSQLDFFLWQYMK